MDPQYITANNQDNLCSSSLSIQEQLKEAWVLRRRGEEEEARKRFTAIGCNAAVTKKEGVYAVGMLTQQ